MAYKLIGKNFTPPDVRAKITGKAKYAEDFKADGMVYIKMLLSPMPNANVISMDASEALDMDGVIDILTADDVPAPPPPADPMLTNNPKYAGQPILAIAAVDEATAAEALEKIKITVLKIVDSIAKSLGVELRILVLIAFLVGYILGRL